MKQLSILNPSKTLHEVLEDQILYIINNYIRKPPYIINVSKKQCWWGNGPHFNNAVLYIRDYKRLALNMPSAERDL